MMKPTATMPSANLVTLKAMIWAVIVVPMLAPKRTPIDCTDVIRPALTKPTSMTVVIDDDGDPGTGDDAHDPVCRQAPEDVAHAIASDDLQGVAHHLHAVKEDGKTTGQLHGHEAPFDGFGGGGVSRARGKSGGCDNQQDQTRKAFMSSQKR